MKKVVRQDNEFIALPYAADFTSHEIKIIEYMISESKSVDKKLIDLKIHKEFVFQASELADILNSSRSRIVADADKLADSITNKKIVEKLLDSNGNIIEYNYVSIISSASYKSGVFKFDFNYHILKYFIDINKNFTEFQLHYLLSFSSSYSVKLYKLLYQYKNIRTRTFTVSELKEQFGASDKYPLYGSFKKYIIDASIMQINKLTDLHVKYKEIKYGRKVEKLEFTFELKKLQLPTVNIAETIDTSDVNSDCLNVISHIESELSTQTKALISKLTQEKGVDYVNASIEYAKKHAKSNLDKYLSDTLTKGWAEVEISKQKAKKTLSVKTREIKSNVEVERQKQIEHDNMNRSEIEHLFLKLTDSEQVKYIDLSSTIHDKHKSKLEKMHCSADNLKLSVFAISNNRSYNKVIESYITSVLKMSLNVNDYLV